jgi:hypothetical protein
LSSIEPRVLDGSVEPDAFARDLVEEAGRLGVERAFSERNQIHEESLKLDGYSVEHA